jgi:hypothetical protein
VNKKNQKTLISRSSVVKTPWSKLTEVFCFFFFKKRSACFDERFVRPAAATNELDSSSKVAPAHVMNGITLHMNVKLVGKLKRDLTKLAGYELSPHLKTWVRPVRRATHL